MTTGAHAADKGSEESTSLIVPSTPSPRHRPPALRSFVRADADAMELQGRTKKAACYVEECPFRFTCRTGKFRTFLVSSTHFDN